VGHEKIEMQACMHAGTTGRHCHIMQKSQHFHIQGKFLPKGNDKEKIRKYNLEEN
jgi:hypothetical protein